MTWQVLDVGSIWVKEFASALHDFVDVVGWAPSMSWWGFLQTAEREESLAEPSLSVRNFPLQKGYHRFPLSLLARLGPRQVRRMRRRTVDLGHSPLLCTTPYYAPVAELWPGPVIYYQTDLTLAYAGLNANAVRALDRRLCKVAVAVCPNSRRVADYMVLEASCDPDKIDIVPNATRASNLFSVAPTGPGELPADIRDLSRPVVGVIGNLAANLNWCLLREAVDRTSDFSWAFVGPTDMEVPEPRQQEARQYLLAHRRNVRFTGPKPYGQLQEYARALDVAVLPYRRKEPTFSGSSTRFYEHLSACRPMIATRGFEELLRKEPLVKLVDNADQLVQTLTALKAVSFSDGWEDARWKASQEGTWQVRAAMVIAALQKRWKGPIALKRPPVAFDPPNSYAEEFRRQPHGKFTLVSPD